jgi:hypothetical protein
MRTSLSLLAILLSPALLCGQASIKLSNPAPKSGEAELRNSLGRLHAETIKWNYVICTKKEFQKIVRTVDRNTYYTVEALTLLDKQTTYFPERNTRLKSFDELVAHELAHILLNTASETLADSGSEILLRTHDPKLVTPR